MKAKITRYTVFALVFALIFSCNAFATTTQRGTQGTPSEEKKRTGNEVRTKQPPRTEERGRGSRSSDPAASRPGQRSSDPAASRPGQRPDTVTSQQPSVHPSWLAFTPPWRRHLQRSPQPSATAPPWRGDWHGGFHDGEYFGKGEPVFRIAEVNTILRDDAWAVLLGTIDGSVWGNNMYRFVEDGGTSMHVQIDHPVFEGRNITRKDRVEIRGEIIKSGGRMIDVKQILDAP